MLNVDDGVRIRNRWKVYTDETMWRLQDSRERRTDVVRLRRMRKGERVS